MVQAKAIKNKFYQNYIPNRNPNTDIRSMDPGAVATTSIMVPNISDNKSLIIMKIQIS